MDIANNVIIFFKRWGIYNNSVDDIINTPKQDFLDMEFIFEEFAKTFEVKNIEKLDVNNFFYKVSFMDSLRRIFNIKINENKYGEKMPITITHMIEVAKRKEWFDPPDSADV